MSKYTSKDTVRGSIFLFTATILYSFYGVFSRMVGLDFGQVFQITARFSILTLFFLLIVLLKKEWKRIRRGDLKWLALMILPGLLGAVLVFIIFNHLPLGTAYFTIYAASTLTSYLLGSLLYREKLTKVKVVALTLSLFGLYLIFADSLTLGKIFYILLTLIGGACVATWNIVSKKVTSKYSVNQILLIDSLTLVILSLPIALILKEPVSLPSLTTPWLGIAGYGVVAIGASAFTLSGYKYLQAQIGSLIMLTEPFFAALVGWFLYREALTLLTFAGGLLIILGASLPAINKLKSRTSLQT